MQSNKTIGSSSYTADPFMKKTIVKKRTEYRVTMIKTVEIIVEVRETVWVHHSGVRISTNDYLSLPATSQLSYRPTEELTRRTVERQEVTRVGEAPIFRCEKKMKSTRYPLR